MERSEKFWNPYLAGIALGLVLLTTFLVMGRGLGRRFLTDGARP